MPKKICNSPQCKELISFKDRYCKEHGTTKHGGYDKHSRDKIRDKFYHSSAWKKKREEMMQYYKGLCQECLTNGLIVPADVIDHIIELSDGGDELDNDNLIALCHAHHNEKTKQYTTINT